MDDPRKNLDAAVDEAVEMLFEPENAMFLLRNPKHCKERIAEEVRIFDAHSVNLEGREFIDSVFRELQRRMNGLGKEDYRLANSIRDSVESTTDNTDHLYKALMEYRDNGAANVLQTQYECLPEQMREEALFLLALATRFQLNPSREAFEFIQYSASVAKDTLEWVEMQYPPEMSASRALRESGLDLQPTFDGTERERAQTMNEIVEGAYERAKPLAEKLGFYTSD